MATIKDVAREAGLTVTTVSRVLNNRGYISDNARKKVYDAMEKLNYKPNEVARSLQRKTVNTIGVIVPHISHPYFAEMIHNLEYEASKQGYRILLCNSQSRKEKEKKYLDICVENRVAGVILFSASISTDLFVNLDVPIITMERALEGGTATVECDNKMGGILAAEKLISCGCKNLLLIGSTEDKTSLPADERTSGFLQVCEEHQIPYIKVNPLLEEYESMDYVDMIERVLKKHPDIDGIFASSDVIAAECIQACHRHQISVPEQMKIVGFDDTAVAKLTSPPLTTVHQPIREMAKIAVEMVKDVSEGNIVAKQLILPVSLIERGTTL